MRPQLASQPPHPEPCPSWEDGDGAIGTKEFQKHAWLLERYPGQASESVKGWKQGAFQVRLTRAEFSEFIISTLSRVFDILDVDHSGDLDEQACKWTSHTGIEFAFI